MSMTLIPRIACLLGLLVWIKFYPLTGKIVEEMKKEFFIMHEQKRMNHEEKHLS